MPGVIAARAEPRLLPLRTPRLLIRSFAPDDIATLVEYRNDPRCADMQDWDLPYTEARAERHVAEMAGVVAPRPGASMQLAIDDGSGLVGDIYVGLDESGTTATLGYTLAPSAHGKGYATEAAGAVVDWLLGPGGVHRIVATTDPANIASIRVLSSLGFRFEGTSRASAHVRGEWLDDDRFALLAADRAAWLARPSSPPASVELVEITDELVRPVSRLVTHRWQERYVSTMWLTFRDALFPDLGDVEFPAVSGTTARVRPWMRAVLADGELVAFVMLADADPHREPYLWRLLVDRMHQRRGIGRRVIALVVERLQQMGYGSLLVSWGTGPGSPEPFYLRLGFVPTGDLEDGEIVARLTFPPAPVG